MLKSSILGVWMPDDGLRQQHKLFGPIFMKPFFLAAVVLVMLVFPPLLAAQKTNTEKPKAHSPNRASIYSAVLPGLGQAYNRKFWKIPIVYAGFAGLGYNIYFNLTEYREFREAYRYVINKDTFPIVNRYIARYNANQLQIGRDYYRRNLELGYILAGAWYLLNIIDATVDAHLLDFDVGEDLSMRIEPLIISHHQNSKAVAGIALNIRF